MYSDERETIILLAIISAIIGFVFVYLGLLKMFGAVVADFSLAAGLFAAAIAIVLVVRK